MTIQVRLLDMNTKVKGTTVINEDDSYTIVLNSRCSLNQLRKTYLHELKHIKNGDFSSTVNVQLLERLRHS